MSTRFFIDTSALVKLYHQEAGTEALDKLIKEASDAIIVISALSRIELISALSRRVRMKELTELNFKEALNLFEDDVSKFEVVSLSEEVFLGAVTLIKKMAVQPGLRTLDALQLSAGLIASKQAKTIFVVSDKKLLEAAGSQDLRVVPIAIEE